MISLSQAFAQWQELAADLPKDDGTMLAESWNDYTDSLCKDGELCALQCHYAPAYDEPMPGTGRQYAPLSDDIDFILDRMGITMAAAFVPFSQSRNKREKDPSLNWSITLRKDGRDVIQTDYMQGRGHCPAYKNPPRFPGSQKVDEYMRRQLIAQECETGRRATFVSSIDHVGKGAAIDPPDLADVLHSLLMDSSAIDCRDFADWCADYGMDSDSIKARAAYDTGIDKALKLRAAFGDKTITEMRELFADY
jgi:hypothetical protein